MLRLLIWSLAWTLAFTFKALELAVRIAWWIIETTVRLAVAAVLVVAAGVLVALHIVAWPIRRLVAVAATETDA